MKFSILPLLAGIIAISSCTKRDHLPVATTRQYMRHLKETTYVPGKTQPARVTRDTSLVPTDWDFSSNMDTVLFNNRKYPYEPAMRKYYISDQYGYEEIRITDDSADYHSLTVSWPATTSVNMKFYRIR